MTIVYIDMDDTICDFSGAAHISLKTNAAIGFPQSQYGFFTGLEPLPGAIEAVNWFRASAHYEPYLLSAPSVRNPLSYTEKRVWVENHFGLAFCDRLILSAHKNLLRGDYLIDDYGHGKGQDQFTGKLIQFGTNRYPDWETVIQQFKDGEPC